MLARAPEADDANFVVGLRIPPLFGGNDRDFAEMVRSRTEIVRIFPARSYNEGSLRENRRPADYE